MFDNLFYIPIDKSSKKPLNLPKIQFKLPFFGGQISSTFWILI